jgi:predicted RNA-binding Zn-ribbon protein involved in translation (DUF1610 family)
MSRDWTKEELQAASEAMKAAGQMTYEEFNAWLIITHFGKEQTDGDHYCPRCGKFTVKDRLHTNALSRHAKVYICDQCGTDEALRDFTQCVLPLEQWAIVQQERQEVD